MNPLELIQSAIENHKAKEDPDTVIFTEYSHVNEVLTLWSAYYDSDIDEIVDARDTPIYTIYKSERGELLKFFSFSDVGSLFEEFGGDNIYPPVGEWFKDSIECLDTWFLVYLVIEICGRNLYNKEIYPYSYWSLPGFKQPPWI